MTALNTTSNIAMIAARFNELKNTSIEVKTLAKRGKAKLLAAIAEMEAAAVIVKAAKTKVAKVASDEPKAETLRSVAEVKLLEMDGNGNGLTYEAILVSLKESFPDAKTSVGCLRWYAAKMTKVGVALPKRTRNKKVAVEAA